MDWMDGEAMAAADLGKLLEDDTAPLPGLVIVDLKSSSSATSDFIVKLRKKIEKHPDKPTHILTVYGFGYKLVTNAS